MNSLSKSLISIEIAQDIIFKKMGSSRSIASFEELKEGFFNAAYHIKLHDGFQCVLKIAPPPDIKNLRYEKDILIAEIETMRLVKARTEIPIPEIFFSDESTTLLASPFYCMEFVNGIPLNKIRDSLSVDDQAEIDQKIGIYLRQMNAISGTQFGCYAHPEKEGTPWNQVFEMLVKNVILDGQDAGVELPLPIAEITEIIHDHSKSLSEVITPSLVHWDLWDGNIFIDPKTHHINGIIDFERSLWADPLMEVNFGAFGINQNFLKGYGKSYPFSSTEQTRRTLYNIYLFLIMVIECTFRHYSTKDQENWARGRLVEEITKLQKQ